VLALLYWLVRDARLVTVVAAGIGGTFLVLALAGWLLVRALGPLRRGVGVAWRYGLANIARRGRDSVVQIVAFGLGLMVLLLLALVRDDLLTDWRASLPADAPNYFMINIRPDEGEAIRAFFRERGLPPTDLVPMVRARLTAINDVPVDRIQFGSERAQGFVEREANLTWARTLRDDNRIVRGEWWRDGDEGGPRVSVEQEYAERLGLKIGDTVTYDVAGEAVTATITSLREVRWDSFQPNFFMVFSPGVLEKWCSRAWPRNSPRWACSRGCSRRSAPPWWVSTWRARCSTSSTRRIRGCGSSACSAARCWSASPACSPRAPWSPSRPPKPCAKARK